MSEMPRKPRGKGRSPALVYRAIRLPPDVMEFYEKTFPNASKKMREVLTTYKNFIENTWASNVDEHDKQEVE